MNKSLTGIYFCVAILLAVIAFFLPFTVTIWDSAQYLTAAENFALGKGLIEYNLYSLYNGETMAVTYQPGLPLFIGIVSWILHVNVELATAIFITASVLVLFFFWFKLINLLPFNNFVKAIALAYILFCPGIWYYSNTAMTEVPFLSIFIITVYYFVKYPFHKYNLKSAVQISFLFLLLLFFRPTAYPIIFAFCSFVLVYSKVPLFKRILQLTIICSPTALFTLYWFLRNKSLTGNMSFYTAGSVSPGNVKLENISYLLNTIGTGTFGIPEAYEQVGNFLFFIFIVAVIVFAVKLFRGIENTDSNRKDGFRLIVYLISVYIIFIIVTNLLHLPAPSKNSLWRYFMAIQPFVVLLILYIFQLGPKWVKAVAVLFLSVIFLSNTNRSIFSFKNKFKKPEIEESFAALNTVTYSNKALFLTNYEVPPVCAYHTKKCYKIFNQQADSVLFSKSPVFYYLCFGNQNTQSAEKIRTDSDAKLVLLLTTDLYKLYKIVPANQ